MSRLDLLMKMNIGVVVDLDFITLILHIVRLRWLFIIWEQS